MLWIKRRGLSHRWVKPERARGEIVWDGPRRHWHRPTPGFVYPIKIDWAYHHFTRSRSGPRKMVVLRNKLNVYWFIQWREL